MELLRGDVFHEVSVSNLTGQYVGEAETKTRENFDAALGGVLFIDEAYRLGESVYGKQVLDEIVDLATKEKYLGKMCLILAGYEIPTMKMLKGNPGALSRFGDNIIKIPNPTTSQCAVKFWKQIEMLSLGNQAKKKDIEDAVMKIIEMFERDLDNYAFYRDIDTFVELADKQIGRDMWTEKHLWRAANLFVKSRAITEDVEDDDISRSLKALAGIGNQATRSQSSNRPDMVTNTNSDKNQNAEPMQELNSVEDGDSGPVTSATASAASDPIFSQSELGILLEEARLQDIITKKELKRILSGSVSSWDELPAAIKNFKCINTTFQLSASNYTVEYEKLMNNIQLAKEQAKSALNMKAKLAGLCPAGFEWVSTPTGYACTGGTHFANHAGELIR